jgi:polyhydroxyalkanoate synthase
MADTPVAALTPDAADKLRQFTLLAGRAQQLMLEHWAKEAQAPSPFAQAYAQTLMEDWSAAAKGLADDPERVAKLQGEYWTQALGLWNSFLKGEPKSDAAAAADKDKRFRSDAWKSNPVYDLIRQAYLLTTRAVIEAARLAPGLDDGARSRILFGTRQFLDAMSPANIPWLNPEAVDAALKSDGESIMSGLQHMLDDLSAGRVKMVDESAFEVGVNIAATPGKVVFENRLIQLIQYAPTTEQVFETPLLILPPWINKFYILDLTPEKSFIRWAVDQGLTVFVVSWRNPGSEFRDATIETYVREGFLAALDAVRAATGHPASHMIGYCVAGTTLAAVLAWLEARGQADRVASATFFTAQVDFKDAGELRVFIEDKQLEAIETIADGAGYLDGRFMYSTFSALRANDLVWSYVVNNYLLGKEYMPFDLLYWNSDATNVPARWHMAYLRDLYRDNKLAKPGGISIEGTPIDLSNVRTPTYVQAGREDHIAPAPSVYRITGHFKGELRFVLAGSGHVAGVVNPPTSGKYQHWVLPEGERPPATLEEFTARATEVKGSWWPDWGHWIATRSGGKVPARDPGPGLEDAPGRYVKEKVG